MTWGLALRVAGCVEPLEFHGDNSSLVDPQQVLEFYMGKNTPDRQEFIIDNLRIELDTVEAKEEVLTE